MEQIKPGENRTNGEDEVAESNSSIDTMKASSRESHHGNQSSCESNNNKNQQTAQYSPILTNQTPQTLIYSHLLSPNVALVNFDTRSQQTSPIQPNQIYHQSTQHHHHQMPTFLQAQHYSPFCTISPATSTNQLPIFSNNESSVPVSLNVGVSGTATLTNNSENNVGNKGAQETTSCTNIQVEFPTQDALLSEIKRLRERLLTLETENASMSMKLNQQQWQVENRLAEIEHQISSAAASAANSCSAQIGFLSSTSSNASAEENERNKESII